MLMRHAHAVFDRTKAVAYLESSNERNIPFYQGHGYELLGIVQVGTCPPMAAMVRMPKTL
jgi:RimJ/RimL family protein N-acetyltransferase